jgi:hypothetical protein
MEGATGMSAPSDERLIEMREECQKRRQDALTWDEAERAREMIAAISELLALRERVKGKGHVDDPSEPV